MMATLKITTHSDDNISFQLGEQEVHHDGGEKKVRLRCPVDFRATLIDLPIKVSYESPWVTEIEVPDGTELYEG